MSVDTQELVDEVVALRAEVERLTRERERRDASCRRAIERARKAEARLAEAQRERDEVLAERKRAYGTAGGASAYWMERAESAEAALAEAQREGERIRRALVEEVVVFLSPEDGWVCHACGNCVSWDGPQVDPNELTPNEPHADDCPARARTGEQKGQANVP